MLGVVFNMRDVCFQFLVQHLVAALCSCGEVAMHSLRLVFPESFMIDDRNRHITVARWILFDYVFA